ncbi:MAG: uroporphyrinogen-III synthase [Pseudomonadota bacterium]
MERSHIPILVTRAEPGASETVARLQALGLMAIKTPVISVVPNGDVALPDLTDITGLIFTSANGVRAFAERSSSRAHTAWCVGPATAAAAQLADFKTVEESAGNALDLAAYISERIAPSSRPLLHIANEAAKGDLKTALEESGYVVKFCPLYRMERAKALSDEVLGILKAKIPTFVLLHSKKGAEAFAALSEPSLLNGITSVAISARAAQPLVELGLQSMHIATEPNEDGLFEALETAVATLSA